MKRFLQPFQPPLPPYPWQGEGNQASEDRIWAEVLRRLRNMLFSTKSNSNIRESATEPVCRTYYHPVFLAVHIPLLFNKGCGLDFHSPLWGEKSFQNRFTHCWHSTGYSTSTLPSTGVRLQQTQSNRFTFHWLGGEGIVASSIPEPLSDF